MAQVPGEPSGRHPAAAQPLPQVSVCDEGLYHEVRMATPA